MPTGNISWGNLTPKQQADYDKRKREASEIANPQVNDGIKAPGKVPAPLAKPKSKVNAFTSIKAYNTRSKRSLQAKG